MIARVRRGLDSPKFHFLGVLFKYFPVELRRGLVAFKGVAMRILTILAAVVSAVAVIVLLSPPGASADSLFTPTSSVRLCNTIPVPFVDASLQGNPSCGDDLTPAAATNIAYRYDLTVAEVSADRNVVFVPGGTTTAGASIPAGTKLGAIRESIAYSVLNGTCSALTDSDFILFNVALPNNPGAPLSSTNLAYPQAQGTMDRFSKWKIGSEPGGGDPSGIGLFDAAHADGTSVPFQGYPKYLLDTYANLIPVAAYGGLTQIQGEWTPYFVLQFSAGQLATLAGPYSRMNVTMGAPLVWVRGDPTATLPSLSNISDTCTPSSTNTMLLGRDLTLTHTRATTPAAGTALYMEYLSSGRDTDQDGFENPIDSCPLNPDVGSPKTGGGDADTDSIDDSCDTAFTPFPDDTDLDGYRNRLDNCPQIANSTQAESETANPPDLGPVRDQIGDPCEGAAITITQNGSSVSLTSSTTVSNGRYNTRTNLVPKCFGAGPDADGDGYCSAEDNADSGACTSTTPNSCYVRHTSWLVGSCSTHPACQMDSDGDTVPPVSGVIRIWSDVVETYLGTDTTKPCSQTSTVNDESPLDNWGFDLDDNRTVNGADWLKLASVVNNGGPRAINVGGNGDGTAITSATINVPGMGTQVQRRFDLNHDGQLTLGSDLGAFSAYMNKACGVAGAPPQTVNGSGVFQQ